MFRRRHVAAVAVAWTMALGGLGGTAYADGTTELQQQINDVLAAHGGEQISSNEIAWDNGNVIMSFPDPDETTAPASSPEAAQMEATVSAPKGTSSADIAQAAAAITADASDDAADEGDDGDDDPNSGLIGAVSDSSCPTVTFGNDFYCFYQYSNYKGRRLQFSAAYSMQYAVMFDAYGFENKTSSWTNKGAKEIYVGGRTVTGSNYSCNHYVDDKRPVLWEENEHSHSPSLGSLDNKADCFWAW
ncbi:peptidase inhibitor family I36 protein [Streptomyces sp. NPDC048208]|uniref:peptidase inhibitor family I36 protein n=1 Tax=Streptomyces sp. NPDC048208 TaxID=3365515 RepID=UPI00371576C0